MSRGREAIALFNRGELAHSIRINLRELGVSYGARIRNVWANADVPYSEVIDPIIPKHGVVLLLVSR
jgi:alpha-galactosidase